MNIYTLIAVILIILGGGCARADKPQERPVPLVEVSVVEKKAPSGRFDVYSASVEPFSRVQLTFRGQGYVAALHRIKGHDGGLHTVDSGDWVTSGTVLARLRAEDFQNRVDAAMSTYEKSMAAVKQAQGQHSQARAAVDTSRAVAKQAKASVGMAEAGEGQAKAQVEAAKAEYEKYRLSFERAVNLLASESMAKADYDAAKAACDMAKAHLDQAEEQLRAAQSRVNEARAAYSAARSRTHEAEGSASTAAATIEGARATAMGARAQLEQAHLDYADSCMKAPMSGVILSRNVEIGSQISPGIAAFEMADIGHVKISFGVPDLVVNRLKLGQRVGIACDAVPGKIYSGRIMTLSAGADQRERTFKVTVNVPNADRKLKVGMIASLMLSVDENSKIAEVITIPQEALIHDPLKPHEFAVFVVAGSGNSRRASLRKVKTGEAMGNTILVLEGLTPGERIITAGASLIKDGDAVRTGE